MPEQRENTELLSKVKDMYHLLTLLKENDLEYAGYRRYSEYHNKTVRERMMLRS